MLKLLVLLNPRLFLKAFDIQQRSSKFNQSACHVKMYSLNFENPDLISGVDGVISIELNIDLNTVSFKLMFIKTNVQNDNSPKM